MIDLPSPSSRDADKLRDILAEIDHDEVDAFYLHLAEGQADNQRSQNEFGRLVQDYQGLTSATVLIHGTALTRQQLGQVKDAGAKLVWSPQSNLRLYGQTTRAADALQLGIPVGLGADWLPSGSTSLLAELKVAERTLARQGHPLPPRQLVEMVTSTAAQIAGLASQLGSLEPDRPADLVVLERRHQDPYESVVAADPSWVQLVMVDGLDEEPIWVRRSRLWIVADADLPGGASGRRSPVQKGSVTLERAGCCRRGRCDGHGLGREPVIPAARH